MPSVSPSALGRARASVAAAFFVHAAVFGSWAPRVPAIKDGAGLSEGELGVALAGLAAGLLAGTRLAARPLERFGTRPVLRLGILGLCAALVGPALAGDLLSLVVALAALGAVGGFLDVAQNAQAVAVERRYARPIMSGLHGAWSLGLLAGGVAGATAAGLRAAPALHFGLVALVLGLASLLALRWLLPLDAEAIPQEASLLDERRHALRSPAVLLLGLVAFAAFVGEGAAADWSAVYLRDVLGADPGVAGGAFAAFALAMAASRLVADRLAARFGPVPVVRAGALLAAGGLAFGLVVPVPAAALAAFALLGAGLGPVVPIAFSAAGVFGTSSALGWVVTLGYVGAIVGPAAIGFAAEQVGLRVALAVPVVLGVLVAVLATAVERAPGGAATPRGGEGASGRWGRRPP